MLVIMSTTDKIETTPEIKKIEETKVEKKRVEPSRDNRKQRVIFPRVAKLPPECIPVVAGGQPITEQLAIELRNVTFGTAVCMTRGEWTRTPLALRAPDQPLSYGLAAPKNGCRSLMSALTAHVIKWLLFESREQHRDISKVPAEQLLRANEERQLESLWQACSEIVWRCGTIPPTSVTAPPSLEGKAIVALPTEHTYVQHSSSYYQDGVTEKVDAVYTDFEECFDKVSHDTQLWNKRQPLKMLQLFEFKKLEDLQIFFKQHIHLFEEQPNGGGPGALLLLYAAVLTRGCDNIKKDLDGKVSYLVSSQPEGSMNVVTLLVTGRATSYLHNGVVYVGDEEHYAMPQYGILARSKVGILVWHGSDESSRNGQQPGSRLKTPAYPIWVTCCAGHYGVFFNTNRELLRNYHAERRFEMNYYTCGGCHVLLSVDTRALEEMGSGSRRCDDISATPLEKLIHTKWQDAKVTWNGPTPYVIGKAPP